MVLQNIIVCFLIALALVSTLRRVISFFSTPVSKCGGCSGCAVKDLKKGQF